MGRRWLPLIGPRWTLGGLWLLIGQAKTLSNLTHIYGYRHTAVRNLTGRELSTAQTKLTGDPGLLSCTRDAHPRSSDGDRGTRVRAEDLVGRVQRTL